jgi:hypothetical protein
MEINERDTPAVSLLQLTLSGRLCDYADCRKPLHKCARALAHLWRDLRRRILLEEYYGETCGSRRILLEVLGVLSIHCFKRPRRGGICLLPQGDALPCFLAVTRRSPPTLRSGASQRVGKVITTRGRAALSADPEGNDLSNWGPKPPSQMCWSDDVTLHRRPSNVLER